MGRQSARAAEWLSDRVLESLSGGAAEHLSGRALEAEQQSAEIVHRQSDQKSGKAKHRGPECQTDGVGAAERRRGRGFPSRGEPSRRGPIRECRSEGDRAEGNRTEGSWNLGGQAEWTKPKGAKPKGAEPRGPSRGGPSREDPNRGFRSKGADPEEAEPSGEPRDRCEGLSRGTDSGDPSRQMSKQAKQKRVRGKQEQSSTEMAEHWKC